MKNVFGLPFPEDGNWLLRQLARLYVPISHYLFPFARLNRHYRQMRKKYYGDDFNFFDSVLMHLNISYSLPKGNKLHIPARGSLILIANHPTGGIDGVILASLLQSVRDDFRIMIMEGIGLENIPELYSKMISVDLSIFEGSSSVNLGRLRETLRILRQEGALIIFPAGGIPVYDREAKKVQERAWKDQAAKLIAVSGATVIPVYIEGDTSKMYQFMGRIHDLFRMMLLPQQILRLQNKCIPIVIGEALASEEIRKMASEGNLAQKLREHTLSLQSRITEPEEKSPQAVFR